MNINSKTKVNKQKKYRGTLISSNTKMKKNMLDKYRMWVKYSWLGDRNARGNLNLFAVCKVEFKCVHG